MKWWQTGVIYQIYPRSFCDANGDGVGDLPGLRARLGYLHWLGVDAIWLSPIFRSPMRDFGYDISNYEDVDPLFGSLSDLDSLIADAHHLGLKVILDLVPNHTSSDHPWFLESRATRDNPKRDWYLWRDAKPDGAPPNNWLSAFGGSAWTWDETTQQFYYHAFLAEQPDLNWRNPEVRAALYSVMRFWLDRGVDGFRIDVLWHLIKDAALRDNPVNPEYTPALVPYEALLPVYSTDQPEVHEVVAEMRAVTDHYDDRVLIGEVYLPLRQLMAYYGQGGTGAHLPFNFQLVTLPWNARVIAAAISEYEGALPSDAWPNWVLGNHDRPRIATRVGAAQARVAAILLLTLRGTPTLYYGDELGLPDSEIAPEQMADPQGKNVGVSRDPQRAPMLWNSGPHAGFSAAEPWLPLARDFERLSVEAEKSDPSSMLALHRRLLLLRRSEPALREGTYVPIACVGEVLAYRRELAQSRWLIVLNLDSEPADFVLENAGEIVLSSSGHLTGQCSPGKLLLAPNDALVIRLI